MEWITLPEVPDFSLEIAPENQRRFGPCSCCGEMTWRVWGFAYRDGEALAAYFVEWTPGHANKEAIFDLIIGRWGEQAAAADRKAVSLGFRHLETGPAFMIQNATIRPVASNPLVSGGLDRDEVLGTTLAAQAFAVCDLVYLGDVRVAELRANSTSVQ